MTPDTHGASTSASKRRAGRVSRAIRRAPVVSFLVLLCVTSSLFFVPVAGRKALSAKRPAGIITTDGGRFVDPSDGSTFRVAGANCYYLAYSSGAAPGGSGHDWVAEVLREATSLKLNVLRVWAFQDEWWQKDRALQTSPGVYNERFLVGLDTLISQAAERGIRLLLCLTNYWEDYGGAMAYVKWAHAAGELGPNGEQLRRREDFFTSQMCRTWFKQFVTMMLSRTNTVTQTAYRDDASIFAWELINEPRVMGDGSGDILQEWIEDMSAFAKGLDEKHLLTVGSEGFYGSSSADSQRNDENPVNWAETMGIDFIRNFQTSSLDFACIHMWVDLWLHCDEVCKLNFAERWIAGHLETSRDGFDKPVLLEEFGKWKPLDVRDAFFRKTFQVSLPPNSPVSSHAGGSLFWHMDPTEYPYNEDGFSVQAEVESTVAGIISSAATQAYASDSPAASSAQKQHPPKAPDTASPSSSDASQSAEVPDATSGASPGTNYRSPSSSSSSPSSPLPDATSGASPNTKYRSPSATSRGTGSTAPATPRYTFDSVPDWGNKNAPASSIPTPFEDVDTEGKP